MSRNLSSKLCRFCDGEVVLLEPARPITREEAGAHYEAREGYAYAEGLFANATCSLCEAPYLAWVDLSACLGYGRWERDRDRSSFYDLSHRRAFNDEPAKDDLPKWRIEEVALTPAQCERLEAFSGTILRRTPWPRCEKTGRKIHLCYGCPCPEHRS